MYSFSVLIFCVAQVFLECIKHFCETIFNMFGLTSIFKVNIFITKKSVKNYEHSLKRLEIKL